MANDTAHHDIARAAHEKEPDGTRREYFTREFLEAFEDIDEEIRRIFSNSASLSTRRCS